MLDVTSEINKLFYYDYNITDECVIVKCSTPKIAPENICLDIYDKTAFILNYTYWIYNKNIQRIIEYIHLNIETNEPKEYYDFEYYNNLNNLEIYKSDLRIISPPQYI